VVGDDDDDTDMTEDCPDEAIDNLPVQTMLDCPQMLACDSIAVVGSDEEFTPYYLVKVTKPPHTRTMPVTDSYRYKFEAGCTVIVGRDAPIQVFSFRSDTDTRFLGIGRYRSRYRYQTSFGTGLGSRQHLHKVKRKNALETRNQKLKLCSMSERVLAINSRPINSRPIPLMYAL
jgi:hypothetical protein